MQEHDRRPSSEAGVAELLLLLLVVLAITALTIWIVQQFT